MTAPIVARVTPRRPRAPPDRTGTCRTTPNRLNGVTVSRNRRGIVRAMERRDFLTGLAVAPLAAALRRTPVQAAQQPAAARPRMPIKQSIMASVWGAHSKLSFEERCQALQRLGFKGMDLPTPEQAPLLKKYGLTPAMMTGAGTSFTDGLVRKEQHDKFEAAFKAGIDTCAAAG